MSSRGKPSVTVAAVIERDGRFLLVEEEMADGLRLNNPAGHLEPGESPAEACAREALEEAALAFEPTHLLGVYLSRHHRQYQQQDVTYLRLAFCGKVLQHHADRALDRGIVRTLWLTPQEVRASADRHRSPVVLRCIHDHIPGGR